MPPESPQLPPKPEVAIALLQTASSVYVHLDPRGADVLVPVSFKTQPQLVLQVGLNMAVAIPDLDVGTDALSCTLSFNRRAEFCRVPWSAVFGLVGEDGRGMIWPESVPKEVAAAADGRSPVAPAVKPRRPKLRVAGSRSDASPPQEGAPGAKVAATETATEGLGAARQESAKKSQKKQENPAKTPDGEPPSKSQRQLPSYLRVVK